MLPDELIELIFLHMDIQSLLSLDFSFDDNFWKQKFNKEYGELTTEFSDVIIEYDYQKLCNDFYHNDYQMIHLNSISLPTNDPIKTLIKFVQENIENHESVGIKSELMIYGIIKRDVVFLCVNEELSRDLYINIQRVVDEFNLKLMFDSRLFLYNTVDNCRLSIGKIPANEMDIMKNIPWIGNSLVPISNIDSWKLGNFKVSHSIG